jgi:hypothetical protein
MSAKAYDSGAFWERLGELTGYALVQPEHRDKLRRAYRQAKGDGDRRFKYWSSPLPSAEHHLEDFLFQTGLPHCHCEPLVGYLKSVEQQLGLPDFADQESASWLQQQILRKITQPGTLQAALEGKLGPIICEALLRFVVNEQPINLPEALVVTLRLVFAMDAEGKPKTKRQGQARTHQLRPKELDQERLFLSAPRLIFTHQGPQFACELDFHGVDVGLPSGADAQLVCGSTKLCNLARQDDGSWRRADLLTDIKLAGPAEAEIEVVYGPDKAVAVRQAVLLWHSGSLVSRYGSDGELHTDPTRRQLLVGSAFSLVAHPQATVFPQPSSEHQLAGGWKVWRFNQGWAGPIEVRVPGDSEPWWSSAWVEAVPPPMPERVRLANCTDNWWLSLDRVDANGVHARLCWSSDLECGALRVGVHSLSVDANYKRSSELIPLTDEELWHGAPVSAKVTCEGRSWRILTTARVYMRDDPIALLRDYDGNIKRLHPRLNLSAIELRHAKVLLLRSKNGNEDSVPLQQADLVVGALDHCQGSLKEVLARGAAMKTKIGNHTYTLSDAIEDSGLIQDIEQLQPGAMGTGQLIVRFHRPRAVSVLDTLILAVQSVAPCIRMVRVDLDQAQVSEDQRQWTICFPSYGSTLLGVALAHDQIVCGTWLLDEHNRSWAYPFSHPPHSDDDVRVLAAFCHLFNAPVLSADVIDSMVSFYANNAAVVFSQWAELADRPEPLAGLKVNDQRWAGVVAQLSLLAARWVPYQTGIANGAFPALTDPWRIVDLAALSPWIAKRLIEQLTPIEREQLLLGVAGKLHDWPKTNGIDALAATQRLEAVAKATTTPIAQSLLPEIKRHLWSDGFAKLVLVKMFNPQFQLQ